MMNQNAMPGPQTNNQRMPPHAQQLSTMPQPGAPAPPGGMNQMPGMP